MVKSKKQDPVWVMHPAPATMSRAHELPTFHWARLLSLSEKANIQQCFGKAVFLLFSR